MDNFACQLLIQSLVSHSTEKYDLNLIDLACVCQLRCLRICSHPQMAHTNCWWWQHGGKSGVLLLHQLLRPAAPAPMEALGISQGSFNGKTQEKTQREQSTGSTLTVTRRENGIIALCMLLAASISKSFSPFMPQPPHMKSISESS